MLQIIIRDKVSSKHQFHAILFQSTFYVTLTNEANCALAMSVNFLRYT